MTTAYRLEYAASCREQVRALPPEIKSVLRSRLDSLQSSPHAGKCLERELAGYRSLRASRFRIIYRVDDESRVLRIHYIGHRKDVYELFAQRLV